MNTPAYFALDNIEFTPQPTVPTADFDALSYASGDYWNGSDESGAFTNSDAVFNNEYNVAWGSWSGFSYSRVNNTNTVGSGNQYAVWEPGTGIGSTGSYAVVYASAWTPNDDRITLPAASSIHGLYVNNTTYAARDMLNGSTFSKKFGGASGNDEDWFKLTVTGKNAAGTTVGSVEFYLADYRFADNSKDYIIGEWTWLDLSALGGSVKELHFELSSSDSGAWGMNTPAYFAIDNLQFIAEPELATANLSELAYSSGDYWNGSDGSGGFTNTAAVFNNEYNSGWGSWEGFSYSRVNNTNTAGYGNQFAVYSPGTGIGGSGNYAIAYDSSFNAEADTITLPWISTVHGFYINNTTYTALSMLNGDGFAKKFGGASGDDPDWFKLTITGKNTAGKTMGTVDFYLADCQFTTNSYDYVLNDWTWVDLTPLGDIVKTLHFKLSSSDVGQWGMNTPAYFALDNLQYKTKSQGSIFKFK